MHKHGSSGVCYRCGLQRHQHWSNGCRFRDRCRMPSLWEHIARVCGSKTQEARPVPTGQGKSWTQQESAHLVRADTAEEGEDPQSLRLRYSLLLHMRGVCLRFTVNSGMCARLWRQFFIAEVTSNHILDWISILQRKGHGGSKRFTEINILFVRYWAFYLPDRAKSEWLCGMNDHHSVFQRRSEPPSSQLKTSHGCCQAGLLALSDCKI